MVRLWTLKYLTRKLIILDKFFCQCLFLLYSLLILHQRFLCFILNQFYYVLRLFSNLGLHFIKFFLIRFLILFFLKNFRIKLFFQVYPFLLDHILVFVKSYCFMIFMKFKHAMTTYLNFAIITIEVYLFLMSHANVRGIRNLLVHLRISRRLVEESN